MPELLTPSQLAALRHHIAGGGQLGNGNARALLATLDEMIGRLVEATWYWRAAKRMLHPDDLEQIRADGRARMESWLNGGTDSDDGELFEELEGGDHA